MLIRTLIFVAAATAFVQSCGRAAFWDVEPVYTGGFASGDASIAISQANVPSISYAALGGLYLATKQVGHWASEFVAPVGFSGGWSSMGFDAAGQPCVAYVDSSEEFTCLARFASKSTGAWQLETIEDVGWLPDFVSLSRDSEGRMCVAYCQTSGAQVRVRFARRIGPGNWQKETVAAVGSFTGPSLAAGDSGSVYVAFVESGSGKLKVAVRQDGGGWQLEDVDGGAGSPAVWYPWVTVGPDGSPTVAYFIGAAGQVRLRFAVKHAGLWRAETAALLTGQIAHYCSIVVTAGGMPIIAYRDPALGCLRHAWKSGGVWRTQTVDAAEGSGVRPCLRLDALGNVHAAYVDAVEGGVRFAWALVPLALADMKAVPDGRVVQLSGVIASSGANDLASTVYVQESDRSGGIRLRFTGPVPPVTQGMILDVQGPVATVNGEREIFNPAIAETNR